MIPQIKILYNIPVSRGIYIRVVKEEKGFGDSEGDEAIANNKSLAYDIIVRGGGNFYMKNVKSNIF